MSLWVQQLFVAIHLFGAFMWVGGLFQLALLLDGVKQEPDPAAKKRLAAYARKAAMLPDIGATIAILFGAHRLFALKLYAFPYMHIKLTLVLVVFALHGYLRVQTKRAVQNGESSMKPFVQPLLAVTLFGIMATVLIKTFQ